MRTITRTLGDSARNKVSARMLHHGGHCWSEKSLIHCCCMFEFLVRCSAGVMLFLTIRTVQIWKRFLKKEDFNFRKAKKAKPKKMLLSNNVLYFYEIPWYSSVSGTGKAISHKMLLIFLYHHHVNSIVYDIDRNFSCRYRRNKASGTLGNRKKEHEVLKHVS
jgi:hypothetical protein